MRQVVGYTNLEVRENVWAGVINVGVVGIQMVFKAKGWMRSLKEVSVGRKEVQGLSLQARQH